MAKAKYKSKHWVREAKASAENIEQAKKEKNEAKKEAKVARLMAVAVGDARSRAENDLTRVLNALAVMEEDGCRLKDEVARLVVERTSLLQELEAFKNEVSSLHSQKSKDKDAMEENYQKALELIFAYGFGCCAFKHSICGDQLEIPDDMPDSANPLPQEFFVNPRCPPAPTVIKVKAIKVDMGKAMKDPEEDVVEEEHG